MNKLVDANARDRADELIDALEKVDASIEALKKPSTRKGGMVGTLNNCEKVILDWMDLNNVECIPGTEKECLFIGAKTSYRDPNREFFIDCWNNYTGSPTDVGALLTFILQKRRFKTSRLKKFPTVKYPDDQINRDPHPTGLKFAYRYGEKLPHDFPTSESEYYIMNTLHKSEPDSSLKELQKTRTQLMLDMKTLMFTVGQQCIQWPSRDMYFNLVDKPITNKFNRAVMNQILLELSQWAANHHLETITPDIFADFAVGRLERVEKPNVISLENTSLLIGKQAVGRSRDPLKYFSQ